MLPWLVRWPAWQPCSAACWRALAALAALVFVLGQQAAAGQALADVASPAPQGPAPPIAPCAQPSPAAPSVAEAAGRLLAGAPPGLTVVPLAVGPASLPLAAPGSL